MLAVIQHQQQLLPGQHPRHRLRSPHPRLLTCPQGRRHQRRVSHGRELGQPRPSAGRPATRRAISAASRVLPDLPGPVTVTSRRSSSSPATSRTGPARPRRSPHWASHVNSPLACYGQQFTAGTANRLSQHTELNVLCAVLGLSSAISTRADSAIRRCDWIAL
jgi:hypothetical protein